MFLQYLSLYRTLPKSATSEIFQIYNSSYVEFLQFSSYSTHSCILCAFWHKIVSDCFSSSIKSPSTLYGNPASVGHCLLSLISNRFCFCLKCIYSLRAYSHTTLSFKEESLNVELKRPLRQQRRALFTCLFVLNSDSCWVQQRLRHRADLRKILQKLKLLIILLCVSVLIYMMNN